VNTCTVCRSKKHKQIEKLLVDRTAIRDIAGQFRVPARSSGTSPSRRIRHHRQLSAALAAGVEARQQRRHLYPAHFPVSRDHAYAAGRRWVRRPLGTTRLALFQRFRKQDKQATPYAHACQESLRSRYADLRKHPEQYVQVHVRFQSQAIALWVHAPKTLTTPQHRPF